MFWRFINNAFVRAQIIGGAWLNATDKPRLYVLETRRSEHRQLLAKALKQARGVRCEELYAQDAGKRTELRELLAEQLQKIASNQLSDVEVVPVMVFHARFPTRERGAIASLFSESWRRTGVFGRLLQLAFNGRQTLLRLGEPLSLRQLASETEDSCDSRMAHKAVRVLGNYFHRQRVATIGPQLSPRSQLIELVVKDAEVQALIHSEQQQREARKMADGIAANMSPFTTRILSAALSWFWRRAYRRVHVMGGDRLRSVASDHQLVYLPCHRSHMDYVMLSWNLYDQGLMLPHVAAGENLNAPLLGPVLKQGGAVFMRRSFRDDPLYVAVFKSYMKQLYLRGNAQEYFIEGGRSRTGRLLPAKIGLLNMTVDNFRQSQGRPVALVPVWISYDKLIESQSYSHELSGGAKQKESLLMLVKTLKVFRRQLGDAALSFGEPVLLDHSSDQLPLKQHSLQVAEQVLANINQACFANETALLATVLLAERRLHLTRSQLVERVNQLTSLLKMMPNAPAGLAGGAVDGWIESAHQRGQISITGESVYLDALQAQEMTFYRNQLHHITLLAGVYLLLAKRYPKPSVNTLPRLLQPLYPLLANELFWPWRSEQVTPMFRQLREQLEVMGLLQRQGEMLQVKTNALSVILMWTAEPVLLRYFILYRQLADGRQMTEGELLDSSARIAAELHTKFGFHSPEYSDVRTLKVFISSLLEQRAVTLTEGRLVCAVDPEPFLRRARQILLPHLVEFIEDKLDV